MGPPRLPRHPRLSRRAAGRRGAVGGEGLRKGSAFTKRVESFLRRRVLGWRTEKLTWLEGVIGLIFALAVGLSWGFVIHEVLQ